MSEIIKIPTYKSDTGDLTVIEKCLPFDIKRIFFLSSVIGDRAKHSHKKTTIALLCIVGSCQIDVLEEGDSKKKIYKLNSKEECLIIHPHDWHKMHKFSPDAILLCFASHEYDKDDYDFNSKL